MADNKEKEIISGRKLVEHDMPEWLLAQLRFQGWLYFLTHDAPVHADMVSEFYRNLTWERNIVGKIVIISSIVDQEIRISDDLLASLFNLKTEGIDTYSKNEWLINDAFNHIECLRFLNDVADDVALSSCGVLERPVKANLKGDWMVLARIIRENLLPTINRDKALGIMECQMMYFILKGYQVNLPTIILQHMAASKDRHHLPYGMILTFIFHKFWFVGKPKTNFAGLLDEKAMMHQKVYKVEGVYYNAIEFSKLPFEVQNACRRDHNLPLVSEEREPILKRSRTVHTETQPARSDDVVDKLKHYLRHKLIKPLKQQVGHIRKQLTDIEQRQDRLEKKFEQVANKGTGRERFGF